MKNGLRPSGIEFIGDIPWGYNICHFYSSTKDLTDILVPYFAAGLKNNELCVWLYCSPLDKKHVTEALRKNLPSIDNHLKKRQMEILSMAEAGLKNEKSASAAALAFMNEKAAFAQKNGYSGIRLAAGTADGGTNYCSAFEKYTDHAADYRGRMLMICSYPLDKCGASEIADAVASHCCAIMKKQGKWAHIEIAGRTRPARTLEKLRNRTELILDSAGEGIFGLDTDGNHTFVNPAAAKMLGYTVEELVGRHSHSTWHHTRPDGSPYPKEECPIYAAYRDGTVHRGTDEFFWRKDGTGFPVEYKSTPILEDGKITGAVVVFSDVTERLRLYGEIKKHQEHLEEQVDKRTEELKTANERLQRDILERLQAEEELKNSEERFKVALKGTPVIVFNQDRNLRYTWIYNPHPGMSRKILGKTDSDIFRAQDAVRLSAFKRAVLETGAGARHEFEFNIKGEIVFYDITIEPMRDRQGNVTGITCAAADITKRRQEELELKEATDYIESLFNYANAPIIVWDASFRITRFNHAFERLTGLKAEDVMGKDLSLLFPEASRADSLAKIARTLSGEHWESVEIPIRRKDGGIRIALWNSANMYEKDGKTLLATIAQGQDITERKNAEHALRESETNARAIFNATNDGIILMEPDGTVIDINETLAGRFKKSTAELKGLNIYDFTPPEVNRVRKEKVNEVVRTKQVVRFVDERQGIWLDNTIYPIFDERGNVSRIAGYSRDITEFKKAGDALQESEEKYRTVIENSNDLIWMSDNQGKITYINKKAAAAGGYRPEEVIGRHYSMGIAPEDLQRMADIEKNLLSGESTSYEVDIRTKTGELITLSVNNAPVYKHGKIAGTVSFGRDITLQKRAEEELRKSEERYRTIVDYSNDMIWTLDEKGRFTFFNKRAEELSGRRLSDWIGKDFSPLILEEDLPHVIEVFKAATAGKPRQYEVRIKHPSGSLLTLAVNTAPIYTGDTVTGTVSFGRDVTLQKQAEEELQKSEERYRTMIEHSNDMIFTINREGRFTFFNKRAEEISGYKFEDWKGKSFAPLIVEEDMSKTMEAFRRTMAGESLRWETRVKRPDGTAFLVSINTAPIYSEGRVIGTVSFGRDVTEQKRAEEELRASEERYRRIIENSNDLIWTTDTEGRFTFWNKRAEEVSGYKFRDWQGKSFAPMIPEEELPKSIEALKKGTSGQSLRWETGIRRGDGSIFRLSINTTPAYDGDKITGITCFARDITEQVEAREEVKRLNRDLERRIAERTAQLESSNKELESFSYSVSHDLRAPLRVIDGFSFALLEDYKNTLDAEGKRFLSVIRTNTQKMGQLIDDLLSHARVGRQEIWIEQVDMNAMAKEVFEEMKSSWPGRRIDFRLAPLPPAKGDKVMLRQVWANIISNALKFTKFRKTAEIEIGARTEKGKNTYYVKDNGAGFDSRYAGKLFGIFQRLHSAEDFGGTGVGLAIVERIIRRHGGRVWAEGEVDKGAAFYFEL